MSATPLNAIGPGASETPGELPSVVAQAHEGALRAAAVVLDGHHRTEPRERIELDYGGKARA